MQSTWRKWDVEKRFKCASHIPSFGTARIDHPKHGLPFAKRQKIRTFLERKINALQNTFNKIPTYPRHNEELREEYGYALEEAKRVYKSVTGEKEKNLEKRVSQVKKNVKSKLHMMYALEEKGGGDMSFLSQLDKIENNHYQQLKQMSNTKRKG